MKLDEIICYSVDDELLWSGRYGCNKCDVICAVWCLKCPAARFSIRQLINTEQISFILPADCEGRPLVTDWVLENEEYHLQ